MNSHNVTEIPKTPLVTNQIIAVNKEKNPPIITYKQWLIASKDRLPSFHLEDYDYIANEGYQRFVRLHNYNWHKHVICLAENKKPNHQLIESIDLTLQTTHFEGKISLVLADHANEVTLATVTNIHLIKPVVYAYHDRKIALLSVFNPALTHVCLNTGQSLYLTVTGGLLLTDNILISSRVLA